MTNANMKLVVLSVVLDDKMEIPAAKLEDGEFIVTKVVELAELKTELESKAFFPQIHLYVLTHGYSFRLRQKSMDDQFQSTSNLTTF